MKGRLIIAASALALAAPVAADANCIKAGAYIDTSRCIVYGTAGQEQTTDPFLWVTATVNDVPVIRWNGAFDGLTFRSPDLSLAGMKGKVWVESRVTDESGKLLGTPGIAHAVVDCTPKPPEVTPPAPTPPTAPVPPASAPPTPPATPAPTPAPPTPQKPRKPHHRHHHAKPKPPDCADLGIKATKHRVTANRPVDIFDNGVQHHRANYPVKAGHNVMVTAPNGDVCAKVKGRAPRHGRG